MREIDDLGEVDETNQPRLSVFRANEFELLRKSTNAASEYSKYSRNSSFNQIDTRTRTSVP